MTRMFNNLRIKNCVSLQTAPGLKIIDEDGVVDYLIQVASNT